MNALKRIYKTVMLMTVEMDAVAYCIAPGIMMVIIGLALLIGTSADVEITLIAGLFEVTTNTATACIAISSLISLSILTVNYIGRWVKEEGQASVFLALPLTNAERFLSVLAMAWLLLPILVFLPLLLMVFIVYAIHPETFILPPFINLLEVFPFLWVISIIISSFYLFPLLAYTKRIGLVVVAFFVIAPLYSALLRNDYPANYDQDVAIENTAFADQDVVGLSWEGPLDSPEILKVVKYRTYDQDEEHPATPYVIFLVCLALTGAAWMGLNRKTC